MLYKWFQCDTCVGCFVVYVFMVRGVRLHCMGGMRCDVSLVEVLCVVGVLLVCVYYECCVWCSFVFMVYV